MNILSLSNHVVRKALRLSLTEMAVLCDIEQMSRSSEYGFWCIKSKDKMADWLDLSRDTVFRAIKSLIDKGYIEKGQTGVRPSKMIYSLITAQEDIGIYIKSGDFEIVSAKIQGFIKPSDGPSENKTVEVAKSDDDSGKIRLSPSENQTQVLHTVNTISETTSNNLPFQSKEFLAAWNDLLEHRKEIRKKVTPKAEELMFKRFKEWGEEITIAAINQSIESGYTGVFKPNDYAIKAMQEQKPTGYEHLKGYNAKLHNNPDFRYKISPSGTAINYERR